MIYLVYEISPFPSLLSREFRFEDCLDAMSRHNDIV